MFYSELVKKACNIMFEVHKDDKDKGGYPYVFHPFYLASQMDDEETCCVALLHDLIGDHGDVYDCERLAAEGFPKPIIDALRLMTHKDGVPYMEYVKAISQNDIAKKVKIADLKHNLDTRRTDGNKPPKYSTYIEALKYLENE